MAAPDITSRERMLADILKEKGIPIENHYGLEHEGVSRTAKFRTTPPRAPNN
jgi:hypothetical protein